MLKFDEILKKLEEVDRVIKDIDNTKKEILQSVDIISRKYSEEVTKKIEGIVTSTVSEYRAKALEEAKKEAEKINREAEERARIIESRYRDRKEIIVKRALEILNI
ncbi:hypothetical protein ODS41_09465 [Pyrobaculum sp. 3827-6]|jgi:pyruvate-formate lyase-activating enzyme|uniref:hypothetical protein n=1 Tax=Pyrobaculum sp. 3827-6 TaxID=2983604 RepID=UPI0021DB3A75|nr:hypothetical protein [Pyrobaculum sp. 3827-6]MCU7788136.1 hypothetical protein [Pyrobaculum sp. 3827-6]